MLQSILVPLDGSLFSEHALPLALSIARRARASVQLVHVHVPVMHVTGISVLDSGADEKVKEQEWTYLDDASCRWAATAPDVPIRTVLQGGYTPDALREQVAEGKADLIVMTTHGRGRLSHLWLGSVTDALVRTCSVPLLVVRPIEKPPEVAIAPPFRQIMIALDGSPLAEQALKPALDLGRLMDSHFTLLRVVKPAVMMGYARDWPGEVKIDEHLTRQLAEDARNYLEAIAGRLREQGLAVQTHVTLEGQPALAILEESRLQKADLLSLATHGRSGLKRLLLGSVADKVLRSATLPVLLYRPPAES
jgi:nucleotide-binding universal stress UspA family protein